MDDAKRKQDLQEQELAKSAVLVSSSSSFYTNPVKGIYSRIFSINSYYYCRHIKNNSKIVCVGYDFNEGIDYHELFATMTSCGFQATNFGRAIEEVNRMLHQRNVPLMEDQRDELEEDEFIKRKNHCTIFLGYTSNMVSSGIRDIIRFLVQHKLVDSTILFNEYLIVLCDFRQMFCR